MNELHAESTWLDALGTAWRAVLPNLVPPDEIVRVAGLPSDAPERAQRSAESYPDTTALAALSYDPEIRAIIGEAGIGPGMAVLDAGCGPGVVSRYLLEAGAAEVVGYDVSAEMLSLAERVPMPTPPGGTLTWMEGDLKERLPFPDNRFDAVWTGSNWVPQAHAEFRRVVRPGGRIVYNIGGMVPTYLYGWDPAFAARAEAAFRNGFARAGYGRGSGKAPMGAWWGPERETNFYNGVRRLGLTRLWTTNVERMHPVPPAFEGTVCQAFALIRGGHMREQLSSEDWEMATSLYDHRSPDYLFRVGDGHFIQPLVTAVCIVET